MTRTLHRFSPPILVYGLIFFLSSRPASSFPDIVPDIIPHFIEYAVLAFLFTRMMCFRDTPPNRNALIITIPILILLAFLDELHQYYVPTRFFEIKDLLVDSIGIAAGVMLYKFYSTYRNPEKEL